MHSSTPTASLADKAENAAITALSAIDELACPEYFLQDQNLPQGHPAFEDASGSYLGGLLRTIMGVPPVVWIENLHNRIITAVVSKEGAFEQTHRYYAPATSKQIPPHTTALFPLWTRESGYGIITIYIGTNGDRSMVIENDRVPAGALARFREGTDLKLYDYNGKVIRTKRVDPSLI